jgi:hypothetical protein
LGFPGYNVQSAFCFLKGRSSRFLQFFAVCSETAMSRQDNYSFKEFVYILAVCVLLCWYGMDIDFFIFLFLLCYVDFSFDIFSGEISLYFSLYFQAVSRVYLSIYYSHLLFCLFWGWIRGNFSGGPGRIFLLCEAPLCGVSGRYDLFECWLGVGGGAVRVFFSWALLRWVRYD